MDLMQYWVHNCTLKNTSLCMVENLNVGDQYIITQDDDEGEAVVLLAVEDYKAVISATTKNSSFRRQRKRKS